MPTPDRAFPQRDYEETSMSDDDDELEDIAVLSEN